MSRLSSGCHLCMFCRNCTSWQHKCISQWDFHFTTGTSVDSYFSHLAQTDTWRKNGDLGTLLRFNATNFLRPGKAGSALGGLFVTDLNGIIKAFVCHYPPRELKSGRGTPLGKGVWEYGGPVGIHSHSVHQIFLHASPAQLLPKDLWEDKSVNRNLGACSFSYPEKPTCPNLFFTPQGDNLQKCKNVFLSFLTISLFCSCKSGKTSFKKFCF